METLQSGAGLFRNTLTHCRVLEFRKLGANEDVM